MELEKMVPKLVEGQLIQNGHRLIYESKDLHSQVVLPLKYRVIIENIDGHKNIQQLARHLFEVEKSFSFKDLFECLDIMVTNKIVTNIDMLNIRKSGSKNVYEKKLPIISKSLFEINLLDRLVLPTTFPFLFVILSTCIIYLGLKSFTELHNLNYLNKFLKINDSYAIGLIFFLIANSFMISSKNIFKMILLLLATGRVYKTKLQMNIFSVSIRVDDSSIYSSSYKWHGILYCFACMSSYFVLIYGMSLLSELLTLNKMMMDQLFIMAIFLTVVDLDPFRKSDISRLFNIFYEEENMRHLLPYLKKKALLAVTHKSTNWRKELLFILYSTLALFWLFNSFSLSLELLDKVFPNLASAFINGSIIEKICSGIISFSLLTLTLYFIGDLLKIVASNIIYPCRNVLRKLFKTKKKDHDLNMSQTLESLREIQLFQGLPDEYLKQIIIHGHQYNYKDGDKIISQGEIGESVYILLEGEVNIIIHTESGSKNHVAALGEKSIFGELALLNNEKRSADVVATRSCIVFEINRYDFKKLESLEGHERILNKVKLNQFISSSDLFDKLPSEAVNLFTNAGKSISYQPGVDIFKQGDEENGFYLLYKGSVTVRINNQNMAVIKHGGFFGEMALLRNDTRNATITTNSLVNVLNISSDIFWKLLFQNLNLAIFLESVATLRLAESTHKGAQ